MEYDPRRGARPQSTPVASGRGLQWLTQAESKKGGIKGKRARESPRGETLLSVYDDEMFSCTSDSSVGASKTTGV